MSSRDHNRPYRMLVPIRWPVGGIRTFIRYVYRHFDPRNFHITLVAPDLAELNILLHDLKDFSCTCVKGSHDPSPLEFARLILQTIRKTKYHVVHSHGLTSAICSGVWARLAGTPHITTLHDVFTEKQFVYLRGHVKKAVLSALLSLPDVIHCVGQDARDNLLSYLPFIRGFSGKLIVIPNGIEVDRFLISEKRDLRRELNLPNDSFLIGFLGRFMSQKGFSYLLNAVKQLLDTPHLAKPPKVLAFGGGGFLSQEKKYIAELGLQDHVYFLPYAPNVASTLRGLDVVAMPSLWEACSLLPMEAMVAGTPVVGTNCVGLKGSLQSTPNVMVPPRDSQALARALLAEMNRPSTFNSQQFRPIAAKRFDVRNQAEHLEEVILSLTH